jgi:LysR family transcriptional regulator, low CO2-responsive transcriptional regulator
MRYVQLRAFHHVAVCGGFSRAAEALHVTQPAISDQIGKLEQEYDVLLFKRNKRQVELTAAGESLLQITRRLFDSEQQALELLSESRAMRAGNLRIVADSASHLLHILAEFRKRHSGVQISLRSGNSEHVLESLRTYDADIGVLGEIPTDMAFDYVHLNATPIVAFVALNHPLAGSTSLRLADLVTMPLVMRERGSKTRTKLEAAALAEGIFLPAAIEAEGREAVREIVASGVGVGFVSQAEFGQDARLVAIPIAGSDAMMMDEALICLRERKSGKLIRAFLEMARSLSQVKEPSRTSRAGGD